MTNRVVVYKTGAESEPTEGVVGRLRSGGIKVLDQQPHMLLVIGDKGAVTSALGELRKWQVREETLAPHPRTHPEILKKR